VLYDGATEILARQHYTSICTLLKDLPVTVRLLTGSPKPLKKGNSEQLEEGSLHC